MAVEQIHLIHHTHADFGYTDLPSTTFGLLADYCRDALAIAARTASFPPAARFHYTCEIGWVLDEFLRRATPAERRGWEDLVRAGQFEVGAMPFHTTVLLGEAEWEELLRQARPRFRRFPPHTCLQNDINGLPWGLLPGLQRHGVRYVMMGVNPYSGGVPWTPPAAFWWEGPDGGRLLTWLGFHYGAGHTFFHAREWRVGPVPALADVWFHPPEGRQIFDDSPSGLAKAHRVLHRRLRRDLAHYPHPMLALQVTNMWRMDNDPPCEQLCHFVRAWNAAGLRPSLRLSTPALFLGELEREAGAQLPVVRGDWADWWADGVTSMPGETSLAQRTKQRLADLSRAAGLLGTRPGWRRRAAAAWRLASLYTEHTFGAYHSVARPYDPLTLGSWAQKANFAYQADEEARGLQAAMIRAADDYLPSSRTRRLTVLNPGTAPRSGWVEIATAALRRPANAVRDVATGAEHPLEHLPEPVWSAPEDDPDRPFEVPDDVFSFRPAVSRFHCPPLAAGERRVFALVNTRAGRRRRPNSRGRNPTFAWEWDAARGLLVALWHRSTGANLIDASAPWGLGQPVFEMPQGFGAREALLHRRPCATVRDAPRLVNWFPSSGPAGARFTTIWDHPRCHRVEQAWDFPDAAGRIELTTTFWLPETLAPLAIYLAFPLAVPDAEATYGSVGHPTRVGADQMPRTCGEFQCVGPGVEFVSPALSVALATPDTPLGCFESLSTRSGRTVFTPGNAHFYAVVTKNYWVTNFPHTKAAKLVIRHLLAAAAGPRHELDQLGTGLWAWPSR